MTALEEEKDITPMNEEGGKEENVTGVVSDGVRGVEVKDDSGAGVGLGDQDVKKDGFGDSQDDGVKVNDDPGVGVGMGDDGVEVNDDRGAGDEMDDIQDEVKPNEMIENDNGGGVGDDHDDDKESGVEEDS